AAVLHRPDDAAARVTVADGALGNEIGAPDGSDLDADVGLLGEVQNFGGAVEDDADASLLGGAVASRLNAVDMAHKGLAGPRAQHDTRLLAGTQRAGQTLIDESHDAQRVAR